MSISGSSIGIIGGSIAGCATAIALERAECDVTVFERSAGELKDRGAGILIPVPLRDQLITTGYLEADYPVCQIQARRWLLRDGSKPLGKLLWHQQGSAIANNWGVLYPQSCGPAARV